VREIFEFKLFNQISDSEHYSSRLIFGSDHSSVIYARRVVQGNKANAGCGQHQFVSNEYLYKATFTCRYLQDNFIFLQVSKL